MSSMWSLLSMSYRRASILSCQKTAKTQDRGHSATRRNRQACRMVPTDPDEARVLVLGRTEVFDLSQPLSGLPKVQDRIRTVP